MKRKFRSASPKNWEENKIDSSTIKTEIPGYPGYYATEEGKVFRKKFQGTYAELKQYSNKNGYFTITVTNDRGERKTKGVHQLVAAAYLGKIPLGLVVDHIDQNRHNNTRKNLRYITKAENRQNSAWSKIKPDDFVALRAMVESGKTYAETARHFNVDESTIRMMCGKCRYNGEYHEPVDYVPTNRKLTPEIEAKILARIKKGEPYSRISAELQVSKSVISKVKKRQK